MSSPPLNLYKFLNLVGISGGGGAGGAGSGDDKRGGTGQGGGSGSAIIAQIDFKDSMLLNYNYQVGGGGAGGIGGNSYSIERTGDYQNGSAGFNGGDTIISIQYLDSNEKTQHSLNITLSGGKGGVGGGSASSQHGAGGGKGGGKYTNDPQADPGTLTIILDGEVIESNNNQYGIDITYKYYKGSKGNNGENNSPGGGHGGEIDNQFYKDIETYFKDIEDYRLSQINTIINKELTGSNYKFKDEKYGDINTKLGQGGLSAKASQAGVASNSYSGRAGFCSLSFFEQRPSYMSDLL